MGSQRAVLPLLLILAASLACSALGSQLRGGASNAADDGLLKLPIRHVTRRISAESHAKSGVRLLRDIAAAGSINAALNGTYSEIAKGFYAPKYTVGPVMVGTPPKPFYLIPDSGSNYLALPSDVSIPADFHKEGQYEPSSSGTAMPDPAHADIALVYGGGGLYGDGGFDTVSLGGVSVASQGLIKVHEITGAGFIAPGQYWEGIWGLCFQGLYQNASSPFSGPGYYHTLADSLYEAGGMKTNSLGAWFSSGSSLEPTGEFVFGGVSPTRFVPPLQYLDILPMHPEREDPADQFGYWLFSVDDMLIDGRSTDVCTKHNCTAFVDTGGPIVNVPLLIAAQAAHAVHVEKNCTNLQENPTFSFVFSGMQFDLGPEHYVYKIEDSASDTGFYCELAVGASGGVSDFLFQLGDPFVRAFYTHFVMGNGPTGVNPRIGFAKSISAPF